MYLPDGSRGSAAHEAVRRVISNLTIVHAVLALAFMALALGELISLPARTVERRSQGNQGCLQRICLFPLVFFSTLRRERVSLDLEYQPLAPDIIDRAMR